MDIADLVARLGVLTTDLASKYQQRGDTLAEKIKAESAAWSNLSDRAVTERRETARAAGAHYEALIAKDNGEIQALETEMAYLRTVIDCKIARLLP
jgi:hypothetical protein